MKISVDEISSVRKSIQIEVPREAVSHELNHALSHLQKEVRFPGFRPGKAPYALLIKKYKETLREEVLRKLIPEYCQKAIEEVGLSPVEFPHIEKIDFNQDAPLSFTAIVDVFPKIQLSNYAGLTLARKEISVTEDEIEKGLVLVQEQQGHLETLPDDHSIALSDYVIIDYSGEMDGKPIKGGKRVGYPIRVGSKLVQPAVEEALLGRKKGESITVETKMPAEAPEKEINGKTAVFKIDIKEIKAKKLPALDDELAKDVGLSSLPELREKVKSALIAERSARQKQDQKNQLINKLIALHPIEAPVPMVERELRLMREQKQIPEGLDPEQDKIVRDIAENRVKGSLILVAIADQEKIEVSDSELENAIRRVSEGMGVPFEKGKGEIMRDPNALRGLKGVTREEKTLEKVYSLAQFEDTQS